MGSRVNSENFAAIQRRATLASGRNPRRIPTRSSRSRSRVPF